MIDTTVILDWLAKSGLRIGVILLITLLAYRLLISLTSYLNRQIQSIDDAEGSELDKRTDTIFRVVRSTGLVLILGTCLLMILTELGIPITPVLASVGVIGLAFGLGAQTLVKDVINGLLILLENQYTVGDVVTLGGVTGTVEEMTLRATIIRDLYGAVHIVPNGEIRIVSNSSRDWSRAIVDVSVTYDEDIDQVVETLRQIGAAMSDDETMGPLLFEIPVVTGVEGLDDWAVRLRIMVKTVAGQHWGVQRHLRRQIAQVFEQKGIELAFPRQDVMVLSANKELG
jgi:small-conductance mechanosensitive channel